MSNSVASFARRAGPATTATAGALLVVGVWMRIHNAIHYPERWGFDGLFNERYVGRLLESLALPAPDTDWSTAHPPLFYYLSAGLARLLGITDSLEAIIPARVASSIVGLLMVALAFWLVRRAKPDDPRHALLCAGFVLFLPAQIYMSAMLNEEILAATFTSLALVGACRELMEQEPAGRTWPRDVAIGMAAGLALLTKLTGLMTVFAIAAAYTWVGIRERRLAAGLQRAMVVTAVALLIGGWFYGRNLVLYGYLYPQNLETHSLMFSMPPGERHLADYLRIPLATWTDPQVLNPDLLRSIWGTTYVTLWYEGHGHFLPKDVPEVKRLGTALLVLAILPTLAFAIGTLRAARRAWREPRAPESPMVLLVAVTLAGYAAFTFSNPWFATVKASYLLGISIPFAYFASGVLADWTRGTGRIGADVAIAVWIVLGVLLLGICIAFTTDIGLWDLTPHGALPGLQWEPVAPAAPLVPAG